jgi:cobalt transporter subunit CbtA
MIIRLLSTGLMAGFLAGLAIATLQHFTTTPLILEAEVFETAAEKSASLRPAEAQVIRVHAEPEGSAAAGDAEWGPEDGLERTFYTSVATIAASIGFAFLLLGGMLASGDEVTEKRAIVWAAAGFVAMGLAPAAGLSPEVPGMAAADLLARQAWWFLTASATALAIWLFLRAGNPWLRGAAVVLLLAPHVLGAPHLAEPEATKVPAELAARFAAMSLAVQAALWIATGFAVGVLWPRFGRATAAEAAAAR